MSDRSDHLIERAAALLRTARVEHNGREPLDRGTGAQSRPILQQSTVPPKHDTVSHLPSIRSRSVPDTASRALGSIDGVPQFRVELAMLERAGLMVARVSRTRTTEEYRIVIGRILKVLNGDEITDDTVDYSGIRNVVMVTSARPGEGKSFTSLNLGGSIAQNSGEKVLIVDVDGKHNSLSDTIGLGGQKGFLDMVADPALKSESLVIRSELPNLSFLPVGSRSSTHKDDQPGIDERRLTPSIERLALENPDSLILLDAPPCLSTSDPHILSPVVGQIVIVVEAERTQRNEVEAAVEMVRACSNITLLLNKVRMSSGHTFGSYDYFGAYT